MRRVKLHKSIVKPKLVMGCERAPFMMFFVPSLLLVVQGTVMVKICGAIFFFTMVGITAFLNSKDPFFFKILFRFMFEQDFYPASASFPSRAVKPNNKD